MEQDLDKKTISIDLAFLGDHSSIGSLKKRQQNLLKLSEKLRFIEVSSVERQELIDHLFKTYHIYNDRASRLAVQACLKALLTNSSPPFIALLITAFQHEASKLGLAPSSALVLTELGSTLIKYGGDNQETWMQYGLDLVSSQSRVLDLCLSSNTRTSIKKSAIRTSKAAAQYLFGKSKVGEEAIGAIVRHLTAKSHPLGLRSSVFLGVIAGVCARNPATRNHFNAVKENYYFFFVQHLLTSRTVVPRYVVKSFKDLFLYFTSCEDLQNYLIPSYEKALLRAPEVVLNDLISPLVSSLPSDLDLAPSLATHLLKPLLSSVKSQDVSLRNKVVFAFETLVGHSYNEAYLERIVDELLISLSTFKLATAEQRIVYSRMISCVPLLSSRCKPVCEELTIVLAKEPNETALGAELDALSHYFLYLITTNSDDSINLSLNTQIVAIFVQGLSDKRPNVRKLWAMKIGDIMYKLKSHPNENLKFHYFLEATVPKLIQIHNEIAHNPQPAAQASSAAIVYIMIALSECFLRKTKNEKLRSLILKNSALDQALSKVPRSSILLNYRVFTKLPIIEDSLWMIRALEACSSHLAYVGPTSVTGDAWAQAFLYVITTDTSLELRREALNALKRSYLNSPASTAGSIICGLWTWYHHVESLEKDSAAAISKMGATKLYFALQSICLHPNKATPKTPVIEPSILQMQLIDMLVLCRQEILPHTNWIDICLRVGVDPGMLASSHSTRCFEKVKSCLSSAAVDRCSATVELAAYNAAAELAFVAPGSIVTLVLEAIQLSLRVETLQQCGYIELAIFHTPEGTAFVDVLEQKASSIKPDKNSRDYDTLKWEEEIRCQIARKKGHEKKLTADETAKINAQLERESVVRQKIKDLEWRLRNGIGFITALANGPPIDPISWLGVSIKALLGVIIAGADRIVGSLANEAYLVCASKVSNRLGTLRKFIGIATIRAVNAAYIPEQLKQESLGDLVTRILYRLCSLSEQRPLDLVSVTYILPLIFLLLDRGGIDPSNDDEKDEQIILALEFISFHADTFSNLLLPRDVLLASLLSLMQKSSQHYKSIKDCLIDLCRSIALNITPSEISVLLKSAIVPQASVRSAVLQGIRENIDLTSFDFSEEIWLASHDDIDEIAELGNTIWQENGLDAVPSDAPKMLPYLSSADKQLRQSASRAMAECVSNDDAIFQTLLHQLKDWYRDLSRPRIPEQDEFGIPKKNSLADPWEARSGIAHCFKAMADKFTSSSLVDFFRFLILDKAVGDANPTVRSEMIESATRIIAIHGSSRVEELMGLFEDALDISEKDSEHFDSFNEAIVILYGSLARHLRSEDDRIPKVVQRLLSILSTPSEAVQFAVANCLPSLVQGSNQKAHEYIDNALDQLLHAQKYATRRGAAYGLAGIISGKGISALREFRVMAILRSAAENKKSQNQRQGALIAYEIFSLVLGHVFEPYIIQIVPQLLMSFGDSTADVREACLDTSKTCFAGLSSYGVKIILPTLLEGLEEQQWRTKKGACDLLGAMAYLDPHQLALSLPNIIPPLTNVLNDSHKEVRASANRSLQRFGDVINNPEVKGLVSVLLKALSDPTRHTDDALDALIKVSFIHYLDAPSLALVVRILERGLGDRSGTKRKAAQIIGSLAYLTERKDIVPHLPILVAGLKIAAVDPVPATRATASKALGSLIERLGEESLPDLIPNLMSTLKSEAGAGDRLGSAQALSEVLAGLGTKRLEDTLPTILQNVASPRSAVREGFMSLFIYLPACFGNSFSVYLSKVIPPILSGLADDIESIRETSLRAGRLLVKNFATRSIDLLLPELDRGLADDSHRIRLSSVDLVGHLLFNLTGISGKTEQDEDEGAAEAGQSLLEALGEEKRNRILSSLYICRCDTSGLVRNAAINVWKALVSTPRTLKDLIPTLTQLLVRRLASSNVEQRVIAGNALGELIRKAGDGVLASLLPTLEESLRISKDNGHRQGICIALREVISSASIEVLEDYERTVTGIVRIALVDPDDEVRDAAAEAFDSLQRILGKKAVDQILPYLLSLLRSESEANTALLALLTLLNDHTRSNIILPNLLPTLLVSPMTSFNAKAIASLSQVSGSTMTRRLPSILHTLTDELVTCKDAELQVDLEEAFDAVLASVDEFDGLNTAMSIMLSLVKHDDHRTRKIANSSLSRFFSKSELDYSRYHQDLIRVLLLSFDDSDIEVVKLAWTALSELTKHLKKEETESLVLSTRQVLQQVGVSGVDLPGFSLPKGINAILPIFLQGLMNGSTEQRINAALAISEIINRTSADALKPFVTQITGPLIRVVSERSADVKSAILLTLNHLLEKIPTHLKPFLPQLQRTFAKALADSSSEVLRSRAAKALGTLITLTPRIDPLIAELVTGSKTSDPGVQNAMLRALYEVVSKAGRNMSEASRSSILGLIDSDASMCDETMIMTNARLLGALVKSFPSNTSSAGLIKQRVLTQNMTNSSVLNLNSILFESPTSLMGDFAQETLAVICRGVLSKNAFMSENSVMAAGKFLLMEEAFLIHDSRKGIFEALATVAQPGGAVNSRRLALVVIRTVARKRYDIIAPHLTFLAPSVFAGVRDPVIPIKLAAEAAFMAIFTVVENENTVFDEYIASSGPALGPTLTKSMQDYFKRVSIRLGAQARERKEAEGGQGGLGLSNDEQEDEREIWSVGKVDIKEGVFNTE